MTIEVLPKDPSMTEWEYQQYLKEIRKHQLALDCEYTGEEWAD